jgi:hypothetical protein
MKKMILITVIVLGLFGCVSGNVRWQHDQNMSETSFRMDQGECEREAVLIGYSPPRSAPYNPWASNASNIASAILSGLSQGLEQSARRTEIFNACMRAKGYYQVVVQPGVAVRPVTMAPATANIPTSFEPEEGYCPACPKNLEAPATYIPPASGNAFSGGIAGKDEAWRRRLEQQGQLSR